MSQNEQSDHRNLMPSMVVKQQQLLLAKNRSSGSNVTISNNNNNNYQPGFGLLNVASQTTTTATTTTTDTNTTSSSHMSQHHTRQAGGHEVMFDEDGIILPKRIPQVPASFAQQPIIRDLNRELKFNQIRGKNVLDQKSELKKALEKLADSKRQKEADQERLMRRTSLEMRLEERAQKISKETSS